MTSSLTDLPAEVLCMVFHQINDLQQLASFRLVCRAWNPVAERAMFSQKLKLGDRNIIKFCNQLSKKPHLGQLVRYMDFRFVSIKDHQHRIVAERIIKLAFTPNIEVVKGNLTGDYYKQMYEAVLRSAKKYSNIRYISWPATLNSTHAKLMYEFKQGLKSLDLTVSPQQQPSKFILNRLSSFSSLTQLTLDFQENVNLVKLEHILGKCRHLENLALELDYFGELLGNAAEAANWMTQNVVQCSDTATNITVPRVRSSEIVEYICFIYPNASYLDLPDCERQQIDQHFCQRIGNAAKNLQNVHIEHLEIMLDELAPFVNAMKSQKNSFRLYEIDDLLDEDDDFYYNGYDILIDTEKCTSTKTTTFSVGGFYPNEIKSMIQGLQLNVTHMQVEMSQNRSYDGSDVDDGSDGDEGSDEDEGYRGGYDRGYKASDQFGNPIYW